MENVLSVYKTMSYYQYSYLDYIEFYTNFTIY